jgi:uncharacterized protein YciI
MSSDRRRQYLYFLEAVDPAKAASRETWTDYDQETFDLHWARLKQLRDARTLLMAGRSHDPSGTGPAIVIFEAESDDEAQRILDEEPFVARGFAKATLHPFSVAISRNEL